MAAQPLIEGVGNSPVRFTYPVVDPAVVCPDYIQRSVIGTSVYDYVFDVFVALTQDTSYGLRQIGSIIVDNSYNRNQRPFIERSLEAALGPESSGSDSVGAPRQEEVSSDI